ncbi:MAG TPA: GNAT family N-acetyltransferase [Anaerolineae bacterium]|nr:GNAT family N-acetyltransferase [Anaerolineae bacterium]
MRIKIRRARAADFIDLARLISGDEAWARYGIDFKVALQLIETAEDEFYLAQDGKSIVGFYAVRLNGVGNIGAYMRMIVVAEPHRNRGVGKLLLDHIWQLTTQHVPNLFLICSTDNIRAQRFYEREEFKPVGILDGLVLPGHREVLYWRSNGPLR